MELKPAFTVHSKTNDTSVRALLNGMHNLFKRDSFPGRFPQLFSKPELQYKQARTKVEESELRLAVLFLVGKRQGDGLFSVTVEMKGKSWCSHDGHKCNLGCREGIGYYGFHMCLQIRACR